MSNKKFSHTYFDEDLQCEVKVYKADSKLNKKRIRKRNYKSIKKSNEQHKLKAENNRKMTLVGAYDASTQFDIELYKESK